MPSPVLGTGFFRGFLANGAPNAGGSVSTFAAGSATPLTTYPTAADAAAGTNANANPVVLNASGEAQIWVNALSYKFVMKDSGGATLETVDNYSPNTAAPSPSPSQWVQALNPTTLLAPVFAFLTGTSFSINLNGLTDMTLSPYFLGPGDRIRTQNNSGFVYSTIVSITGAIPNVITVVNDGASVIDAGISAMYYGLMRFSSPSAPGYLDPRTAVNTTKNGNQVGVGASAKVTAWNAASPDPLGEFTTPQFTCKYPGRYLVNVQAHVSDSTVAGVTITFGIGDNGVALFQSLYSAPTVANAPVTLSYTKVMTLTVGQVIAAWWTAPATTTLFGTNSMINVVRIP